MEDASDSSSLLDGSEADASLFSLFSVVARIVTGISRGMILLETGPAAV